MGTTTQQNNSAETTSQALAPLLAGWQAQGFGPFAWLAPTMMERMSDMGSAWLSFFATRIEEDVAWQHAMLHSGSPAEAQVVHAAYLERALDQYMTEAEKMAGMFAHLFDPELPEAEPVAEPSENVNV